MANQSPLSGLTPEAGGYLLPDAQGEILAEGILQQAGALSIAGDTRVTSSRREVWPIWKGKPTASFVGEGGTKPVTGAEFAAGTLNIKKVASIVLFTDEMLEDVQGGDLNVLVDGGVRDAISDVIDANAIGLDSGSPIVGNFDTELVNTSAAVEYDGAAEDGLRLAVSAAMGTLEENGYSDFAVLVASDLPRHLRDARVIPGGGTAGTVPSNDPLYVSTVDPLFGLPRATSTNLNRLGETAGSNKVVAVVVSRPNLHVRIRKQVLVSPSTEATVDGVSLFQNNLTAVRYETRLGFWAHDLDRAVVKITNAS